MMLLGWISRCTMPRRCAWPIPASAWRNSGTASSAGVGPRRGTIAWNVSPSPNSIYIAVHNAQAMRMADPRQRLAEQRDGLLGGDGAAARHHRMERLTIHEFHHHVGDVVLHQKGIQGGQVGVI